MANKTKSVLKQVATANARQKNFAGGKPGVTKLGASAMAKLSQASGASKSHAVVAPKIPKRTNLTTFRDRMKASGEVLAPVKRGGNRSTGSHPADMVGTSASTNKNTKKVGVKTPANKGPKVTYQKRAAKGAGKKPYILGS